MVQEINFLQLLEKKRIKGTKLSCYISKAEKYEPMHKRSMDNLLQCEMRATIQTLKDRNLPLRLFIIDLNDQKQIGSLMMLFFIETIFGCYILMFFHLTNQRWKKEKN